MVQDGTGGERASGCDSEYRGIAFECRGVTQGEKQVSSGFSNNTLWRRQPRVKWTAEWAVETRPGLEIQQGGEWGEDTRGESGKVG